MHVVAGIPLAFLAWVFLFKPRWIDNHLAHFLGLK